MLSMFGIVLAGKFSITHAATPERNLEFALHPPVEALGDTAAT
jgi:hypothetical protein